MSFLLKLKNKSNCFTLAIQFLCKINVLPFSSLIKWGQTKKIWFLTLIFNSWNESSKSSTVHFGTPNSKKYVYTTQIWTQNTFGQYKGDLHSKNEVKCYFIVNVRIKQDNCDCEFRLFSKSRISEFGFFSWNFLKIAKHKGRI